MSAVIKMKSLEFINSNDQTQKRFDKFFKIF
jgi:hypothetical protein